MELIDLTFDLTFDLAFDITDLCLLDPFYRCSDRGDPKHLRWSMITV